MTQSSYDNVTLETTLASENQSFDTTTYLLPTSAPKPTAMVGVNCTEGSGVIWASLGMCLENALQYLAFLFAIASLCFHLFSHLFLLRARHLERNASQRQLLSLVQIFLANLCNLIGATLSDQLGTQVLIAGYLVGSDVVYFIHFLFIWCTLKPHQSDGIPYTIYNPTGEWKSPDQARGKQNGSRTRIMCLLLAWLPAALYLPLASSPWQPERMQSLGTGRKLLMVSESPLDNFGFTLGIFAVIGYSMAKVPLVKDGVRQNNNILRHFHVINLAVLANICYVLSIILFSQDLAFLINALPWLLICCVCTFFDVIVIYLLARQQRKTARERAAAQWEEGRDPRIRDYEDGEDGTGLNDDGDDDGWVPQQEPRLSAIHEDEENGNSDEPPYTRAEVSTPDREGRGGRDHHQEGSPGRMSPLQALPPPPQHPRGGRRQKTKAIADNFGEGLEWDLSDMSKTYREEGEEVVDDEEEDDEDVIWDEELILKEVEAELSRREHDRMDPHGDHVSDVSVHSLEFEEIPMDGEVAEGLQDEWFDT